MKYLILIGLFLSCTPKPFVPPNTPVPTCAQMCGHLDTLGCNDRLNTLNDSSCMSICNSLIGTSQQNLISCFQAATSCQQVDVCDTE